MSLELKKTTTDKELFKNYELVSVVILGSLPNALYLVSLIVYKYRKSPCISTIGQQPMETKFYVLMQLRIIKF